MKTFKYKINGKEYEVAVDKFEDQLAEVTVNGASYKVELEKKEEPAAAPKIQRPVASASSAPAAAGSGAGTIKSPLPGIIVDIKVKVGDAVNKGDVVAVLEAMKMENAINAPVSGKVASISVNAGDSILEGVTILTIE
ncbi:biotin carboxyl carrier protein [Dysgonomonas sp. PH5-45]|uniref:biotin/lipoyl-containing protein n=1 Tax=unclassified Dysgonomonas TaxID=2630389 RepID=UPI0024751B15|nr:MULTISPECIES: biotin/lipoyl-containing protein [unclassified Dysgonomonas]MDH6354310.1 biotin carboxyl carrier protein [Dysgonomonas sp. PH5-45]MDH6387210.1 biotin carboxyl carrier protein [Dysgonomonas sp. PH5-37]